MALDLNSNKDVHLHELSRSGLSNFEELSLVNEAIIFEESALR